MTYRTWVATHTGLPSFWSDTPLRIRQGDRILSDGTSKEVMISDPFAVPGVPTEYILGTSTKRTMTRVSPETPAHFWGVVTDNRGRTVPGLVWLQKDDPRSWKSKVADFNEGRLYRWPLRDAPRSGEGTFHLADPDNEEAFWDILRNHSYMIAFPPRPTPGIPPRTFVVESVERTWAGIDGSLDFAVSWTEVLPAEVTSRPDGGKVPPAVAPIVTWGEWDQYGKTVGPAGWQAWSAQAVAKKIAGMPA